MKPKLKVTLSDFKLKLRGLQQYGNYKTLFYIDLIVVGYSSLILIIAFILSIVLI